jgi:hypothetical protein
LLGSPNDKKRKDAPNAPPRVSNNAVVNRNKGASSLFAAFIEHANKRKKKGVGEGISPKLSSSLKACAHHLVETEVGMGIKGLTGKDSFKKTLKPKRDAKLTNTQAS